MISGTHGNWELNTSENILILIVLGKYIKLKRTVNWRGKGALSAERVKKKLYRAENNHDIR